ncbi:hypothetical protein [Siccirubricoccus sp. G192]|uniref:hypothetical protein n=1 Tax=Siccirubricoccus sp. G192 TaxID=2849651 RepID=UPI001C2BCD4F|nr:hypothetical protein [Siccirubricoccus sp. G192]MBV1798222.1 hypothetical protein [Siccirubricoccus sp. G192]
MSKIVSTLPGFRPGQAAQPVSGSSGSDVALAEQFFVTQRQVSDVTLMLAEELVGFGTRRWQAQISLMEGLRRCSDLQEAMELQMRFIAETSTAYADEAEQVLRSVRARAMAEGPARQAA